jgi:hypothetical protein
MLRNPPYSESKSSRLRREPTVADAKQTQPQIDVRSESQILQINPNLTNLFKSFSDENIEKTALLDKKQIRRIKRVVCK